MHDGPDTPASSDGPQDPQSLDAILEEFIGRHQADPSIDLEAFLEGYPVPHRPVIRQRCLGYLTNLAAFGPGGEDTGTRTAPEAIGPFRILERIGTGGMATVYRVVDERNGEQRALKVLHPHLAGSASALARFEREFRVMTELRHPRLATLLEAGHDGEWHYIVMERVFAKSLADVEPPADVEERTRWALELAADMCDALEYIHENDVIHRDVKPGNILMTAKGKPSLADFGFARMVDTLQLSLTASGQLVGTPYYMSPEQLLARRAIVDARSDLFSLGAILYELLAGKRPFTGNSEDQLYYAISFTDARPLRELQAEIPADVETVCMTALEKSPAHRYPTAAAMGEDLRRCLEGIPIHARRPGPWRRAGRRLARTRVTWAGAALVGVLAASAGMIAVDRSRSAAEQRARTALLTVTTEVPGAEVGLRSIDAHGAFGPLDVLGTTPLEGARVETGFYRVVVTQGDGTFAELSRYLEAGAEVDIAAHPLASEDVTGDMILIPESHFLTGQHPESDMFPEFETTCPAFYVDRFEVTMGEYKAYLDAHPEVPWPDSWGSEFDPAWSDLPAVGMTWYQARDYAEFLGKRLLTRDERLRLARGTDGRDALPGLEGDAWRGNSSVGLFEGQGEVDFPAFLQFATPVGAFPMDVTPEGVRDILGSVSEWVDGPGHSYFEGHLHTEWAQRFAIGESWRIQRPPLIHPISSLPADTAIGIPCVGIRCARSTDESVHGPPASPVSH